MQSYPVVLSEMMELFHICTAQYGSHMLSLSTWNVASETGIEFQTLFNIDYFKFK